MTAQSIEYCLLGFEWWASCLNKSDWASWVQAIGSILALVMTGGLAWWEAHQRRIEASQRERGALLARLAVLDSLGSQVSFYLRAASDGSDGSLADLPTVALALRLGIEAALRIGAEQMPSPAAVGHMMSIHVHAAKVLHALTAHPQRPLPDEVREDLRSVPKIIEFALASIKRETGVTG